MSTTITAVQKWGKRIALLLLTAVLLIPGSFLYIGYGLYSLWVKLFGE